MGKASRRKTTTLDFSTVFFADVDRVCDAIDRTLARMILDELNEVQLERVKFLTTTIEGFRKLFKDEAVRQLALRTNQLTEPS